MPSAEAVYQLDGRIKVMKPATIKAGDLKHEMRLSEMIRSDQVAAEEKIDGCRYKMYGCYFISKDHNDKTDNFPHLQKFFTELGMPNLILDGEIMYPERTSQYCVRVTGAGAANAIEFQNQNGGIHYRVFDILRLPNGEWTANKPYHERRKLLELLCRDYFSRIPGMLDYVQITQMTIKDKQEFIDKILSTGGEGVVLKKLDGIYQFGKKPLWEWMKIKQHDTVDLIITGHKPPTQLYTGGNTMNWPYWQDIDGMLRPVTKAYTNGWPGALQLSAYVGGELKVICYAAGLSEPLMIDYTNNPDKYIGKVARISYMEKTTDGNLRHPAFKELHEDKTPDECVYSYN